MKQHAGPRNFFSKFTAIALSLLSAQPTFAQSTDNQQMVFEGSLTDVNGNVINLSGVPLNFYVTTASGCYLYGESSISSGDGQGNIVHRFGGGSALSGSPNSFSQNLFFGAGNGTMTGTGNSCTVAAGDSRLAQVYYPAQNITATIKLGTVPYAQNATMLSGKSVSDFVQASADTSTLLFSGTSGQYLSKSASGLVWTNFNLSAAQVSTALGYTPSSGSQTLTASGITSALGYIPAASGAIVAGTLLAANNFSDLSSLSAARANLGLGNLATQNFIDLNSAQVSGTLSASRLPALSGDITTVAGSATATLAYTGVIAGSYSKVTVDQKGRVTSGSSISGADIVNALGYSPIGYLNGATAASQIFAIGNSGLNPNFVTASATHTLNLPMAAAGSVTAGLISNSEYTFFTNKLSATASAVTGALGYSPVNRANNLSDIVSATQARVNLGLGTLATKNSINIATDVTGVLPAANGGSKWTQNGGAIYTTTNVGIGTTTPTNTFQINSDDLAGSNGGFKFTDGIGSLSITDSDNTGGLFAPAINGNITGINPFIISASTNNDSNSNPAVLVLEAKAGNTNIGFRPLLSVQNNQSTMLTLNHNGNLALGSVSATAAITLSGTATRAIAMARNSSGSGHNLELIAGGASLGSTNFSGGNLILSAGTATGSGNSAIEFKTAFGTTGGTIDINPTTRVVITGDGKVGIGTTTPNAALVVSGGIKIGGDGSNASTTCSPAEEGKQRYNSVHKTMEFCDGTYWNGTNGPTHCESPTTGYGAGVVYTLIGKAGTGGAFCMSRDRGTATYINAVDECSARIAANGSRMGICEESHYLNACRQYTNFGANAELKLPNFNGVFYWTHSLYLANTTPSYSTIGFIVGSTNVCNITNKDVDAFLENTSIYYRCCYQ